ncbi:SDR family NAD(P)-dependent oxidoreductase [Mesorhizobium sp.]|uniref:SDR family NAD(P)-dependent oxidoreductase n=1 Tax=Mesorhizobium sp. TaxID=1871066 RepID=UPI000FE508AB|nr:SDR family NAD(P)-dependent oxidoreductase [Mesorhizobium sp.]RWI88865.1 MAG: SDR family oxidoreductase [Mesorhizobium sp.]
MSKGLKNSVIIVTGAAQGIGRSVAKTLANSGAAILLADIQASKLADVEAELTHDGHRVATAKVDITDTAQTAEMAAVAIRRFGRIDGLVCCAGIDAQPGLAWEIDEAHWRRMVDVDLSGTWWCVKAVIPAMMKQRSGRIVLISSTSARTGGRKSSPAYSAAKAGLLGLTVSLSLQLEEYGILINAVTPGATGSTGTEMSDAEKRSYLADYPLGFGGPQPVADAVTYLLGSSGDWISGTVLNVSGGRWRGI